MFGSRLTTRTMAVLLLGICCLLGTASVCHSGEGDLESLFDAKYQTWMDARAEWIKENPGSSSLAHLPEQCEIEEMGPAILPLLFRKLEDDLVEQAWDTRFLADNLGIVQRITCKSFTKSEYPDGAWGSTREKRVLFIDWWNKGRKGTPAKFRSLFYRWTNLLEKGKKKEAAVALDDATRMGIEVLPFVMDEVRKGDSRYVALINKLMCKKVLDDTATTETALQWWEQKKDFLKFPPVPPDPPVTSGN